MSAPRILICRLSHVGDCILTIPVLNSLRRHFPEAFLAWIVEPPADQLLWDHPALDELIVVNRGWLKSPRRVAAIRRQLRALRFDVSIDPQSLTKSAIPALLSRSRRRIGFSRGIGRELAPLLNNGTIAPQESHLVDRSLELLLPMGIRAPNVEFSLPLCAEAKDRIEAFIRRSHLALGFAVLNPGAGWHSRRWPPQRYASVARHLGEHHSLPSVITWAGSEEGDWANQIVDRAGGHAFAAPKTNLRELACLIAESKLFVGSDTGPLHLAAALGVRCVGLYGTTKPENSGPYGDGHIALQAFHQNGKSRRRANNDAMRAIDTPEVFQACGQLLAASQDASNAA